MPPVSPATVDLVARGALADGMYPVCDLDESQGPYLHDARTGKDYLDFASFGSSRPLGFNHPRLRDPELALRLGRAAVHKAASCDLHGSGYGRLAETFADVALGGRFRRVCFVDDPGRAVHVAVEAALRWKALRSLAAGKTPRAGKVVSFAQAFHGRTGYGLSISDLAAAPGMAPLPRLDWPRVSSPTMRFPFDAAALADTAALERRSLAEIERALEEAADEVAAVVVEPIQGEGGDNYFRGEFLGELRRVCDARECLLVFDEVQTGFGATGRWWDWQHHGVEPDLMVFGKKAQVAGLAATERLAAVEGACPVPARSWVGGNLVDLVRAERVIQVIVEDHLLENAATMGSYLLKLLREQAAMRSELTNVRGRGLWAAFDLPSTGDRDHLVKACFEEELLVLPSGSRSIRLRPALDIGADAVGRAAAQLEAAVRRAFGRRT